MLFDVSHGVEVRCREVTDVEVDAVIRRHRHRRGEALGRGELIGVGQIRMAVKADAHLVFVREGRDALRDAHLSRRGDGFHAEGRRHIEGVINLFVGGIRVHVVGEKAHLDARVVELRSRRAECRGRRALSPCQQRLAARATTNRRRAGELFDIVRHDLGLCQANRLHRGDDLDRIRDAAEAVGDGAELDAGDHLCLRGRESFNAIGRVRQQSRCQPDHGHRQ